MSLADGIAVGAPLEWAGNEPVLARAPEDEVLAALVEAVALSGTDFGCAVAELSATLAPQKEPHEAVLEYVGLCWHDADVGAIAALIYLLAPAHSPDLAVLAGWHALELGCDNDIVIVALADVLHLQPRPNQSALSLLRTRFSEQRSAAFHTKLADYYRDAGQAFLAEDMLRLLFGRGHQGIIGRLAEHWTEFRDWSSVRDLLRPLSASVMTPELTYLLGRSCLSLLLEDELYDAVGLLSSQPAPGPCYAALLKNVWAWRVGQAEAVDLGALDGVPLPSLIARDDVALRAVVRPAAPASPVASPRLPCSLPGAALPNVLGIGMQRTATSWLWHHLIQHPEVETPIFKEPVFFSDLFSALGEVGSDPTGLALGEAEHRYWEGPTRNLSRYLDMFRSGKSVRADISPTYGELPEETVGIVRDLLGPDVRILFSVRDPVERSWSNLKYDLMTIGHSAMTYSLEQRIALYQSVATLRRCNYSAVLRTWRRFFGRIKVVFFDDVLARPGEVITEVDDFLGLAPRPNDDRTLRVNVSGETSMPLEDRAFLFGLHQQTYREAEAALGGPARHWRQRQLRLLGNRPGS